MLRRVGGESTELAEVQDEDQDLEEDLGAYTHNPLVFDEQDEDLIRDQGKGPSNTASTAKPRERKQSKGGSAGFGFVYSPLVVGSGYNEEFPVPITDTAGPPQSPDLGSITAAS